MLGGGYLALPKCAPDYVTSAPPEGNVRTDIEVALIFAALSGLTAPIIEAVETGTVPGSGATERVMRLVLASGFGIGGAFALPCTSRDVARGQRAGAFAEQARPRTVTARLSPGAIRF